MLHRAPFTFLLEVFYAIAHLPSLDRKLEAQDVSECARCSSGVSWHWKNGYSKFLRSHSLSCLAPLPCPFLSFITLSRLLACPPAPQLLLMKLFLALILSYPVFCYGVLPHSIVVSVAVSVSFGSL